MLDDMISANSKRSARLRRRVPLPGLEWDIKESLWFESRSAREVMVGSWLSSFPNIEEGYTASACGSFL